MLMQYQIFGLNLKKDVIDTEIDESENRSLGPVLLLSLQIVATGPMSDIRYQIPQSSVAIVARSRGSFGVMH